MRQNPDLLPEVGENVALALDTQARRAALFQAAMNDIQFLAKHGDIELLRAIRDLNTYPGSPDSYRHAHEVQMVRGTVRQLLITLGFEQAIVSEPPSKITEPGREVRPPIVDVQLP